MNYSKIFVCIIITLCILNREGKAFPAAESTSGKAIYSVKSYNSNQDHLINGSSPNGIIIKRRDANSVSIATGKSDGHIVFPTDDLSYPENYIPVAIPLVDKTFSEHAPEYPYQSIENFIKNNSSLNHLAGMVDIIEIGQRISNAEYTSMCVSEERVVYPQKGKNKDDEWEFILNTGQFRQGVRIEECAFRNESMRCDKIETLSSGYKSSCEQKYVYRILASTKDGRRFKSEHFAFPSSCCCLLIE